MKYAFALAAVAGLAAAQPHVGHAHLHKKAEMHTVTDWTVVTVTDVVTVYGEPPAAEPTAAPADPPQAPSSAAAAPVIQSSAPAAPPAQSPAAQSPAANSPAAPAPSPSSAAAEPQPKPAESSPAASAPAPASSGSSGSSSGGSGGSTYGMFGLQPGASAPADCTEAKPCGGANSGVSMTEYTAGEGACGWNNAPPNDKDTVALQKNMFGDKTNTGENMPSNPLCGKKIKITNPQTQKSVTGVIRDRCVGCSGDAGIDLSDALWQELNPGQAGNRWPVEWYFIEG